MGEHDAASVVGQLAGLTTASARAEKVTPEQLIRRFCPDGATETDGVTTASGHCGYIGVRGGSGDGLVVGFDDGYDFMGCLNEHGWRVLPEKGDWPYWVFMGSQHDGRYAFAEYCEGDLRVTVLPDAEKAQAFYADLPDEP